MKENGAQAKIAADMIKGDKPFDAAAVHKIFAAFQDAAVKMLDFRWTHLEHECMRWGKIFRNAPRVQCPGN